MSNTWLSQCFMGILSFIPHNWTQISETEVQRAWVAFPRVIQVAEVELELSRVGFPNPCFLNPGPVSLKVGVGVTWELVRHTNSWALPHSYWFLWEFAQESEACGVFLTSYSGIGTILRTTALGYCLILRIWHQVMQVTWVPEQGCQLSSPPRHPLWA